MVETWTNLTFHGVGVARRGLDRGEAEVWLSRDAFLGHLDVACENERLLITFDDGNLSDFEISLPAVDEFLLEKEEKLEMIEDNNHLKYFAKALLGGVATPRTHGMTIPVNDFRTALGRKALVAQGIDDTFGEDGG